MADILLDMHLLFASESLLMKFVTTCFDGNALYSNKRLMEVGLHRS